MSSVLADTHAVVWYLHAPAELSRVAQEALDAAASHRAHVCVSAISLVEIVYLEEKGRIGPLCQRELDRALRDQEASRLLLVPVDADIAQAVGHIPRDIVPDMPDRIIAATALHLGLPLVTKDERIRSLPLETIW